MTNNTANKYFAYWQPNKITWLARNIIKFNNLSIKAKCIIVVVGLGLMEFCIYPHIHIERGFHCDDRSIAYKFTGDTISTAVMVSSLLLPFFLMWLTEAVFCVPSSMKSTRIGTSCLQSFIWYREYWIGMILHLFFMDTLKDFVGGLRPHFLDTCKPDAAINCSEGEFITEYACTNTIDKAYFVRDSSKSFPSGHSSIAFFEAIFMMWYIQQRIPNMRSKMLIPILQVLCLLWAVLCSISRITDNRHHWWDVFVGAKVGIFFGILTCKYLCKNFTSVLAHSPEIVSQNGNVATVSTATPPEQQ